MCGRGSLTRIEAELEERFDAQFYSEDLERYNPLPSFNIAPTHMHPIVTQEDAGHFIYARWGLIPFWAKEPGIGSKMINARMESLREKASFKTALIKRRCIIPMDGFYEWKVNPKGKKQAYRIGLQSGEVFFMAGIYDRWKDPKGNIIQSFSIITGPANEFMKTYHDRMPAILLRDNEKLWLDDSLGEAQADEMLLSFPGELMQAYAVSDKVNNVRNNDPSLIEELSPES